MSHIVRLILIAIISVYIFSFIGTRIFSYFYQSDAEIAIQKSSLYLEQVKKSQDAYLEAEYKSENYALKQQLEFERKVHLQIQSSKDRYGYKTNAEREQERIRQKTYEQEQQKIREERREKQRRLNEKKKREYEQERADRAHVRKENMKTCNFWTAKYKETPSNKNKYLKEKSCERAYQ